VLVVEAGEGAVSVEAVPINEVSYRTETVEVSGLSSSDAVREKVQGLSGAGETAGDIVRVVLAGQPDVDLDLDPDGLLHSCAPYFRYLDIDNRTQVPFDLTQMRTESTTRGAFIRIIEERLESAEGEEREVLSGALHYGLRAFTGMAVRQR